MAKVGFTTMGDIMARMPEIDDHDVAERAKTDMALAGALEMARPANWWGYWGQSTALGGRSE